MTAPVRIEAKAWSDLRFATVARLMGFADLEHGLIKVSRIWSWQTEHFTPERPTYVVDQSVVDAALGLGGAAAVVRAQLAEETPDGLRMRGTHGRIEWLYQRRQSSAKGGEATKRKHQDNERPIGPLPAGHPAIEQPPAGRPAINRNSEYKTGPSGPLPARPGPRPEAGPLSLLPEEDLSPARARAIPLSTEPAPAAPSERHEARMLWGELEQARADAAAELGVEVQLLTLGDVGERDLADLVATARARGAAELDKLVGQARHAIAMAKQETASGEKPFEWFTGAVFSPNNFRRLVGKTAVPTVRAGPKSSAERAPEPARRRMKTF